MNEGINGKITTNRDRYTNLLNKLIAAPSLVKIMPIIQIQYNIRRLLEMHYHCKVARDERQLREISNIGISYFYYLINGINENINEFVPAQELSTMVLSQLGVSIPLLRDLNQPIVICVFLIAISARKSKHRRNESTENRSEPTRFIEYDC